MVKIEEQLTLPGMPRKANFNDEIVTYIENQLLDAPWDYPELVQKIAFSIIGQIRKTDTSFVPIEATVSQLAAYYGVAKQTLYNALNEVSDQLTETKLFPYITKDGEIGWDKIQFFSRVNYERGVMTFYINQELRPFILQIEEDLGKNIYESKIKKSYTRVVDKYHKDIKGKHTLKIFRMLLKRGFQGSYTVSLGELKTYLSLDGAYSKFKYLQNRVLEPARKEIISKSNVYFTYTANKDKNINVSITFHMNVLDDDMLANKVINDLRKQKFSESDIEEILAHKKIHPFIIYSNIQYAQSQKDKRELSDIIVYTKSAILNNYAKVTKAEILEDREQKQKGKEKRKLIHEVREWKKEHSESIEVEIAAYFKNFTPAQIVQDILENANTASKLEIQKLLANGLSYQKIVKDPFLLKAFIRPFIAENKIKTPLKFTGYLQLRGVSIPEADLLNCGFH